MCNEAEFIERATKIVFNACKDSMAKVKEGDTIVIDYTYKNDYGDFRKWIAGDEFKVERVDNHIKHMPIVYCVATKAPVDEGGSARGKVGDEVEFSSLMPLFDYLKVKGDMTAKNNLCKLCRDYLEGLI